VATAEPSWAKELAASPLLEPEGCFEQLDRVVCLFHPRTPSESPVLRLDRDAHWEYGTTSAGWPLAQLLATRPGVLDYPELGRCRLAETTRLGAFTWTRLLAFPGSHLRA